jgi:hypothetical protein
MGQFDSHVFQLEKEVKQLEEQKQQWRKNNKDSKAAMKKKNRNRNSLKTILEIHSLREIQ